jgi:hypothetical protein
MADVLMAFHRSTFYHARTKVNSDIAPMRFLGFSNHEKGAPRQKKFEVINGLQHVLQKWVGRCKKCIACQGGYFEKETVTAPP